MRSCLSRPVLRTGLLCALLVSNAHAADAQAWVPPAHVGAVTFLIQRIDNTGHRPMDGTLIPDGKSTDVSADVELDYAFTNRLSITVGLPYVFAKYVGPGGAPPGVPFLPVDACFCWHSGWQDVSFTARYNAIAHGHTFSLTPSIAAGVPSHDYAYRGEAVLGSQLEELRLAVDAGERLDAISSRLSIEGRYSYACVERVLGISHNRSNASIDGVLSVTNAMQARVMLQWQHTHGGLQFPEDVVPFPDRVAEHDRLLHDDNFRLGAGASYQWNQFYLFGSYIEFVSGVNAHAGHAFTVGVSRSFAR